MNPYLKNSVFYGGQLVIRIGSLALGLVLNRWIVTYLSVSEYAAYSIIFDSILPLVFVLISFSLPLLLQKFYTLYTKDPAKRSDIWTTFLVFRVLTGLGGLCLVMLGFTLIQSFDQVANLLGQTWQLSPVLSSLDLGLLILLFLVQFLVVVDWNYRAVCDALGRTWQFGLTDIIAKTGMVALLYALTLTGRDLTVYHYAWILIGGYGLALGGDAWWQRKVTSWGHIRWSLIRENVRSMTILSISGVITYLYLFSFQVNLSFLGVEAFDLATFSNAYNRVFLTFVSIPAIIMPHIATRITQYLGSKDYRKARVFLGFVLLFGLCYGVMYLLGSWAVLEILDPQSAYPNAHRYVIWLFFAMIWYPLIQVLGPIFVFFHKEKYEFIVACILAFIGLIAQYYGIITWGIAGAIGAIILVTTLDVFLKIILYFRIIQYLPKE